VGRKRSAIFPHVAVRVTDGRFASLFLAEHERNVRFLRFLRRTGSAAAAEVVTIIIIIITILLSIAVVIFKDWYY
jgi:hypothetical protein